MSDRVATLTGRALADRPMLSTRPVADVTTARQVIGDQPVAAARRERVDLARHRVQLAAELHGRGGGEQRAGAIGRLDHHHRARQPGDDPVAPREVGTARRVAWRQLADERSAPATKRAARDRCRGG